MRRSRLLKYVVFLCVLGVICCLFFNKSNLKSNIEKLPTACYFLSKGEPLDTSHVVNSHPFINTIVPRIDCDAVEVCLLVYVHTSVANHQQRSAIRRTWGNISMYHVNVRLVFVVGEIFNKTASTEIHLLDEEAQNYGDILQSNFVDTYRNLSIKAVAGLKWITQHCRSAKYVLKTDDDTFVNMYLLLLLLKNEDRQAHYRNKLLLCNVCNVEVNRYGKWKTTEEECSMSQYPSYCQGIAFVMSMDVAIALYNASFYVPMMWIDDVYITGFLPALLPVGTINTVDAESFYMSTWHLYNSTSREVLTGPDLFRFVFYPENDLKLYDVAWHRLTTISQRTEFKEYAEAVLSVKMRLKRQRLKRGYWKHLSLSSIVWDIIANILY